MPLPGVPPAAVYDALRGIGLSCRSAGAEPRGRVRCHRNSLPCAPASPLCDVQQQSRPQEELHNLYGYSQALVSVSSSIFPALMVNGYVSVPAELPVHRRAHHEAEPPCLHCLPITLVSLDTFPPFCHLLRSSTFQFCIDIKSFAYSMAPARSLRT
jgi:hypothetical protein